MKTAPTSTILKSTLDVEGFTKKLIILILLCAGTLASRAQQYFNVRYPLHSTASFLTTAVPINDKYLCLGEAVDSTDTTYSVLGLKIAVLDNTGNIIKDTIFSRPHVRNMSTIYNNNITPLGDSGFIFAVSQNIDPVYGTMFALLIRLDTVGNIVWTREYDKPFCIDSGWTYYTVTDLKPTGTGEWLMLSTIQCRQSPINPTFYVLTKLDSRFNVEWNKQYGSSILRNPSGKIVVDKDGYLLGGAVSNQYYPYMININWQAHIIRTDTAGNQLWDWVSDPTKETNAIQDMIRTKDGGYLYCGFGNGYREMVNATAENIWWKQWIEKMDSDRHVVWSDTISHLYATDFIPFVRLIELGDSSVVVGGTLVGGGFLNDTTAYPNTFGCLLRYRPDGAVVFRRKYSYNSDTLFGYIYDVSKTPDGGYVLCGGSEDHLYRYGPVNQQSWVIKVDSNGCSSLTDPQCATLATPRVVEETEIHIFPNPATDRLFIRSETQPQNELLTITDMYGKVMLTTPLQHQQEQVNLKDWTPGVYFYCITAGGNRVKAGKISKM